MTGGSILYEYSAVVGVQLGEWSGWVELFFLSNLVCHVMSCHVLSCHVMLPAAVLAEGRCLNVGITSYLPTYVQYLNTPFLVWLPPFTSFTDAIIQRQHHFDLL